MGKRLTQKQFIEKLNKKFPDEDLELMDDYKNKRTKVIITTASLSDKAIEELKEEWNKTYYN